MAVNGTTETDLFLLRMIKRLKAGDARLEAAFPAGADEMFGRLGVDYVDAILDYLGVPAESHIRYVMHYDLLELETDAEVLSFLTKCREQCRELESQGFGPAEQWSDFDNYQWGSPPPFELEVHRAIAAGAQLHHGMNCDDVEAARCEAESKRHRVQSGQLFD